MKFKIKTKKEAYESIAERIEFFHDQKEIFKGKNYDETKTRIEFIDPLFSALNWDISNKNRKLESYKDVLHEDRLRINGNIKAPDYCFRIKGERQFFLEAKKPSIAIKTDIKPSYQIRAYGWNAGLPISILTDFEEFSLYDCSYLPKKNDKASKNRLKYITYEEYLTEFDWIWDTFSKEQVEKGSLDSLVKTQKRGTDKVDDAFLKSLSKWRSLLASNIASINKNLTEEEINYFVQMNINRLVFLRNSEDRGAEPYGLIKNSLTDTTEQYRNYKQLFSLFEDLDKKYNSGLFDLNKDKISNTVSVSNSTINQIVNELYYPESPYLFSVIGVEILGTAYERFLGNVIKINNKREVEIKEKPEVKKAGGVFYTPNYIVDYIIENTVGKIIKGKSPEEIKSIKICDPACGSGSFLLGAYQYILAYHLNWHAKKYKKSWNTNVSPLTPDGNLKIRIKKEILLNNIFGVDIDSQAVEVTKLSLLMKCMEGENSASVNQTTLALERILPTLDDNIKCGNSLIDFEFYNKKLSILSDEIKSLNPFDWETSFSEIFKHRENKGFDVIIGNPPYVDVKVLGDLVKNELSNKYVSASDRFDLYVPFVEKGIQLLNKDGLLSYILPSMFARRDYGFELRKEIVNSATINEIVDFGTNQVFKSATNYVSIYILGKGTTQQNVPVKRLDLIGVSESDMKLGLSNIKQSIFKNISVNKNVFNIQDEWYLLSKDERKLFNKLSTKYSHLGSFLKHASEGIHSGKDPVFFVPIDKAKSLKLENPPVYNLAKGKDIHRYDSIPNKSFKYCVIYPYDLTTGNVHSEKWLSENSPNVFQYLKDQKLNLAGRGYFEKSSKKWYELWCQRKPELYTSEKIVGPEIANKGEFTLSENNLFVNNKIKSIVPNKKNKINIRYLLGLLNSSLLVYYHRLIAPPKDGGYFEVKTGFLKQLPIKDINFEKVEEVEIHDKIVNNVSEILSMKDQMQKIKSEKDYEMLNSMVTHIENKIDFLVYDLFELNQEEISIVEESKK